VNSSLLTGKVLDKAARAVTNFGAKYGLTRRSDFDLLEDLDGVARETLLHAIDTYDPSKASFNTWWSLLVKQALRAYFRAGNNRTIHVPEDKLIEMRRVNSEEARFTRERMRLPTRRELADYVHLSVNDLNALIDACAAFHIQCDTGGESSGGYDMIDEDIDLDGDLYIQGLVTRAEEVLAEALVNGSISSDAARVTAMTFGISDPVHPERNYGGMPQIGISAILGISQSEVSRQLAVGVAFLRKSIGEE